MNVAGASKEPPGDWFDRVYGSLLSHRAATMREALVRLHANRGRLICETGSVRSAGNWVGDGQSTLVWAAYGKRYAAAVMTVDKDPAAAPLCKRLVKEHCGTEVHCTFRTGDGAEHLAAVNQPIDLLYLDSHDFLEHDAAPAQMQALKEFYAAEPWLHVKSLVLIDDCRLPHGGKGGLVIPEMESRGWQVAASGYQVLMQRSGA